MTFEAITNIAQAETEAKEMIASAENKARQMLIDAEKEGKAAIEAAGFHIHAVHEQSDWLCITAQK